MHPMWKDSNEDYRCPLGLDPVLMGPRCYSAHKAEAKGIFAWARESVLSYDRRQYEWALPRPNVGHGVDVRYACSLSRLRIMSATAA